MKEYRIEEILVKKLVGKRMTMSFAKNQTGELWKNFMPRRREITNNVNQDLISMQIYPSGFFANFHSKTEFEKWAAIEVTDFNSVPEGMDTFVLSNCQSPASNHFLVEKPFFFDSYILGVFI